MKFTIQLTNKTQATMPPNTIRKKRPRIGSARNYRVTMQFFKDVDMKIIRRIKKYQVPEVGQRGEHSHVEEKSLHSKRQSEIEYLLTHLRTTTIASQHKRIACFPCLAKTTPEVGDPRTPSKGLTPQAHIKGQQRTECRQPLQYWELQGLQRHLRVLTLRSWGMLLPPSESTLLRTQHPCTPTELVEVLHPPTISMVSSKLAKQSTTFHQRKLVVRIHYRHHSPFTLLDGSTTDKMPTLAAKTCVSVINKPKFDSRISKQISGKEAMSKMEAKDNSFAHL